MPPKIYSAKRLGGCQAGKTWVWLGEVEAISLALMSWRAAIGCLMGHRVERSQALAKADRFGHETLY
jgi:hypothetical protein